MLTKIKEKFTVMAGSLSGAASILGSWQVCHNVCLGLIVLLSFIGIAVAGMPLLFLTKIALPVWILAVFLLAISLFIYIKKKCISGKLLLFNTGLITAGTPFQSVQAFIWLFWVIGGVLAAIGIFLFIGSKLKIKS